MGKLLSCQNECACTYHKSSRSNPALDWLVAKQTEYELGNISQQYCYTIVPLSWVSSQSENWTNGRIELWSHCRWSCYFCDFSLQKYFFLLLPPHDLPKCDFMVPSICSMVQHVCTIPQKKGHPQCNKFPRWQQNS